MNKLRNVLIILSLVFTLGSVSAAAVTAQLSADETSVGNPVEMQINVEGTTNVVLPDITVDGLDIRLTGRQTMVQINNGRMTTSGIYNYTINPLREGSFEIPAIQIDVDGHKETTDPMKLLVQTGTAPPPPSPGMALPGGGRHAHARPSDSRAAYAEMLVPKKTVYVGEVIPVEIRFYFREGVGFQPMQNEPQITGEGFTVQKMAPPTQTSATVGDDHYQVLSFKTAISAVKSGNMEIPAASLHGVLRVPTDAPSGMQGAFDQFFGGAMGGFTDDRETDIKSAPTAIRVNALPVQGRPADFAGAVGDFTIAATADPVKAKAGDPITLKVAVSGRGNFDAMGDPTLVDADGWRTYPPANHFAKSDAIGYSGTKTFETPMVALQTQTHTPVAAFSYFDPEKEKYFTLQTQPVAVDATADQTAQTAAATAPEATPSATPVPKSLDGTWLTSETSRAWRPVVKWPGFWILNGIATLVLAGSIATISLRRARQGPAALRAAKIRERDRLIGEIARSGAPEENFYAKALQILGIQSALAGEKGPFEFVRSLEANGRDVSDLHTVLSQADALKFSGGETTVSLGAGEQARIVQAIQEACK